MKKIYILTIALFCLCVSNSHSQWVVQTTGATQASRGVLNISIVDANTVWISMFDGSGANPPASLREFSKTTDGGATWTAGTISAAAIGSQISQIAGASATVAFAVFADPENAGGSVFKTVNGGTTWTSSISVPAPGYPNTVHFWDVNTGIVTGDPRTFIAGKPAMFEIYTTTNGGTTWSKRESPAPISTTEYGLPSVMAVNGNHVWFGTTKGRVYHSSDKGITWTVGTTNVAGNVTSLAFQDANTGFLIMNGAFYKTTNGGNTWSLFNPVSGTLFTTAITYVPGTTNTYVTVGDLADPNKQGSSISIDGGNNWITVDYIQHTSVAFLNSNTGWSGGFAQPLSGGIFKWEGLGVGISENKSTKSLFSFYPNPSNATLNLVLEEKSFGEKLQVDIFDIIGNKVISERLIKSTGPLALNVANLPVGTYFIKVSDGIQERTEKFVKF